MKLGRKVTFDSLRLQNELELMDVDNCQNSPQLPQLEEHCRQRGAHSIPRTATPVPPAGLNYIEINAEDFDLDYCMMESRSSFYDLANAPPLLNDSEMEVTMTGEKRKTTPPDLLTLSHMYFEKNQKTMKTDHPERPGTSGSYSRNLVSSASIRSVPAPALPIHDSVLDRHNLGLLRPRKLTPLTPIDTLHKTNQIRIVQNNDNKQHRALHMSVNYNGNGWKQTLDPIIQNRKESDPDDQKLERRKNTYSISSQEDRESNIGSQI